MSMLQNAHLVPVKPLLFTGSGCPYCGSSDVEGLGTVWPGIHVMGEYRCRSCHAVFLRDLPVGFAVDFPMAIGRSDGRLFNPQNGDPWIHQPLLEGFNAPSAAPVPIERIVRRTSDRIIILNTLDFLYGHVLLKLFNASHYLKAHPELGLVIILPRMYAWLIPEGVAEVWLVDQKLSSAHGWHTQIDAFVQEQLPRYREVYLGKGYAHPEVSSIDISTYSRITPFPLAEFTERAPHFTFVARTDRLWFNGPVDKFLCRAFRKLGLGKSIGAWFVRKQTTLINRSMRCIKRSIPNASFTIVGLGRKQGADALAEDLRTTHMNADMETSWCRAYAKSHAVIGVHGSNMLLPTAHAAGLIEILPDERFRNIVQDVYVRWPDRMQLFLYRFVDEYATPQTIARHAISLIHDFPTFHRDNRENIF